MWCRLFHRSQNGILLTLDLAKAFDSIDRDILMNMLPDYGFEGKELEWVKSYFSNRRQVVSVLGVDSTDSEIQHRVIQGGTLAALFSSSSLTELIDWR
ncbi:Reverse transcriptase (RNA-dependent DNA polymerase) [Nesidiocoris tenuis]|uniref:Reverse transcriptase (RNA-dependent DNA polymerase) n=1 Tax=Nesidiocoris tenuis TaxID=355587 RepID=A0ABN7AI72_9HEMI|nr:Reverse transcriptase (RNA-dependent DNA polymerase) [Nesidiocoris tenuis]